MSRNFSVSGESVVYENPWMRVREMNILRDGQAGIYGVVDRQDSVVLIVRVAPASLLMLKQYRFPTDAVSWEFPMGGIDPGESPISAAERELREETGLRGLQLSQIGSFNPIPGLTPQLVHVFETQMVSPDQLVGSSTETKVDEILGSKVVALVDMPHLMHNSKISDGFTLTSFALWQNKMSPESGSPS